MGPVHDGEEFVTHHIGEEPQVKRAAECGRTLAGKVEAVAVARRVWLRTLHTQAEERGRILAEVLDHGGVSLARRVCDRKREASGGRAADAQGNRADASSAAAAAVLACVGGKVLEHVKQQIGVEHEQHWDILIHMQHEAPPAESPQLLP